MADPIEYQVPLVSGICSSQSSMDQYIQSLNMALDLSVQVINEELGEDFSLPGIPPLPLPQSPNILLPELMPWERKLRLGNTPVPTGHLGNVFPLRNNKKSVSGKLTMPGVPEALIGAPYPGAVPGVDPSTYIINFLNQNIALLFDFLVEQGFDVEPIVFPTVEICNQDTSGLPGPPGASPGQIIINELLRQNLKNALEPVVAGCVEILRPINFDDNACYVTAFGGSWSADATEVITPTSFRGEKPAFHHILYNRAGVATRALKSPHHLFIDCASVNCRRGVRFDYSWAYEKNLNRVFADLATFGVSSAEVGGGISSNADPIITINFRVWRIDGSGGEVLEQKNYGAGLATNARLSLLGDNQPVFSDSGTDFIEITAPEFITDTFVVISITIRYGLLVSHSGSWQNFMELATSYGEVTGMSLSFL